MQRRKPISVLLLDDSSDLGELYKLQLERAGPFRVSVATDGQRARLLAEKQLFDVIIIDAKLDYRGLEFGGLRLADDLRARYGTNSILIISRFITEDLMRDHGASYEFMDKHGGSRGLSFGTALAHRIVQMHQRQYVFIAMPFSGEFDALKKRIQQGVKLAGYRGIRADEVMHTGPMHQVMFELVEKSKLVVFVADGANANAYYEAGFADAMKKEVVIVAKSTDQLKFDVANRHTITYENKLTSLAPQLQKKLVALRLTDPVAL